MSSAKILLSGNEAVVYGALLAGCDCYFGYPITPASEIAHTAAVKFPLLGRVFLQAESEIAAINMVMGAAASGRRVMTASSGLGISLKQETISYMAGCELPCVIVDNTRGGPGLGNIAPEQADYNQVVKGGGHGSYQCIVLAPFSAQEMCDLAFLAFELAERYRTPVYMMADGVVGQMMESVELGEPLPPREIPDDALAYGKDRNNYFTSIYLGADELEERNIILQNKYQEAREKEQRYDSYCCEDAEVVVVAYGIIARLAQSAVETLRSEGHKIGLLRPITLFPFPEDILNELTEQVKCFAVIEMSCGQMINDVKLAINCKKDVHLINRMGGNVPSVDEMISKLRGLL